MKEYWSDLVLGEYEADYGMLKEEVKQLENKFRDTLNIRCELEREDIERYLFLKDVLEILDDELGDDVIWCRLDTRTLEDMQWDMTRKPKKEVFDWYIVNDSLYSMPSFEQEMELIDDDYKDVGEITTPLFE